MKKSLLTQLFLFCLIVISTNAWSQGWTGLGSGTNGVSNGYVKAIVTLNGKVYVAGQFTTVGGSISVANIARWDGTANTWSALGSGITGTSAEVKALCVYGGAVYAAGHFTSAGGTTASNIAKWDPTSNTWSAVGATQGTNNDVYSMYVFNNLLYVGGSFITAGGGAAHYVGTWNGTTWSASGNGTSGYPYCFAAFNGELYAGVQGGYVLDKLVSNTWVQASTLNNAGYSINSMCVYNTFLYVSGIFTVGPVQNIAKFNGSSYAAIGSGQNTPLAPVGAVYAYAMKVFNNKLWVGGPFTSAGSVANTAKLAAWSSVSGTWTTSYASPILNSDVLAMDTGSTGSPSTLYLFAAGQFTAPFNRVMRGVTNVGIDEVSMPEGMVSVYPNPAHGRINIHVNKEIKNPTVELYNILGNKVYSDVLRTELEAVVTEKLAPGVYFVKVFSQETGSNSVKVFTQKVIIE